MKLFSVRVMRHRNSLPREAVNVPSLKGFKARLDGTLNNFVKWKVSLLTASRLELDDLQVPSSPEYFMTPLDERRKSLNS